MSEIQQFYAGKIIFITGGTGFLGKILLEKLLRSCPDIKTLYLLIRAKKGKNFGERIDSLLVDPVFGVLRGEYPDFATKIIGIDGDISEPGLGLSTTDYERLVNEVSMIFHLAATVRFDETLDKAVNRNVNSTKCIVDIARACKNLKAAIYVSTAYSNCVRETIQEKFYRPPLSYKRVNQIVDDIRKQRLSEDEMENFTEKTIGEWPNTYSFTKAIAEGVVVEFAHDLPFAIFRPSIVSSSYREPMPGWIDGPIGLPGLMCAGGLGIAHVGLVDTNARSDLVPVDYVCNALISCAWETAITVTMPHEDIPVYNYVSGNQNPITWGSFINSGAMYYNINPSSSADYYASVIHTKSICLSKILPLGLYSIPAIVIDTVARLLGRGLVLYKTIRTFEGSLTALSYFAVRQWEFEDDRTQSLWKRIGPQDRAIFPFDIQSLDWDEYVELMAGGLRKYILGERMENL